VPGCPPHPFTILDGLLRLLGRLDERAAAARGEAVRRYREEIHDDSIRWGTLRAEEGMKYLAMRAGPDERKPGKP